MAPRVTWVVAGGRISQSDGRGLRRRADPDGRIDDFADSVGVQLVAVRDQDNHFGQVNASVLQ